jgi:heme O synthase-like polyprenyltransferase
MFVAFVGLVIVAVSIGTIYGEVIGWLTLGAGIMVLAAINGVLDRWDDSRMQRLADRDI